MRAILEQNEGLGALFAIAVFLVPPAAVLFVLMRARARRRREIAAMRDVPPVLHGVSEEVMLEYLETSDGEDKQGALSAATGGDVSLGRSSEDEGPIG
jgi:hypothetical protein